MLTRDWESHTHCNFSVVWERFSLTKGTLGQDPLLTVQNQPLEIIRFLNLEATAGNPFHITHLKSHPMPDPTLCVWKVPHPGERCFSLFLNCFCCSWCAISGPHGAGVGKGAWCRAGGQMMCFKLTATTYLGAEGHPAPQSRVSCSKYPFPGPSWGENAG